MDFNLIEMLMLRYEGMKTMELAARYDKDRSTISYHCIKHSVAPDSAGDLADMGFVALMDEQYKFRRTFDDPVFAVARKHARLPRAAKAANRDKYADIFDPPVNKGKSYRSYLKEAKKRQTEGNYERMYASLRHL